MPSAQGRVVPLEFNRGASSYLPPFVDPSASAHNLRIGWLRQVFGSISNEDTVSITPSSTSGSGEGSTTAGTHSQSSATSGVVRTSNRTAAQTTRLDTRLLTPTGTIPFTTPSETDSSLDTDTRTTESSGFSRPSLATKSWSSSTTGRRSLSSKPSPLRPRSTSTSRRITTRTFTLLPKSSSSISHTTTPIRTASPSHSRSSSRPSLDTEVSSSSCSHILSVSDSVASLTATLVTSLPVTTTIWITLPTTVSITITSSNPTSIPIPIPTTATTTMSTSTSTFPSTSSSPPTTLPADPFSTSSDPITLPGSVSSSGALSSTSYSSSATDSSSSSPSSFSSTSTSSGSVLQEQTTTSTTTKVPVPRTTLFTTVVKTSMTVDSGRTSTRTTTEVVPTGTLMPGTSGAGNIFARDKGALAGLILGCIALAGLIVAWALFAYRRHRVRRAQDADAVAALRSGPGRTRAVMLDEEDDEDGHAADMAFLGAGPVSRTSGGVRYARLRGGKGAAEDGGTQRQDVSGGGAVGFAPASISRGLDEEMEDAVLMHPANRSDFEATVPVVSNGSSPGSQVRPSVSNSKPSTGPEPAEWLGGRVASSPNATTAGYFDGAAHDSLSERPASPSSVYSDEVMSSRSHSIVGAMGTYMGSEQLVYGQDNYASSSTQGHGAIGSSSGGHGSSNDDKIGGSSSGDVPSSTTHSSQLLRPRPVPVSAPSSLLPTKTAPPTSVLRDLGDIESVSRDADQRRKSGFLERSLRSLRLRSPRTELAPSAAAGTSAHEPSATPHASIAHLQPQTLGSVPHPLFRSEPAIPEGAAPACTPGLRPLLLGLHARTASGAPVWPGLGSTAGRPVAPSPAPTEGSTRTPDGLLNPKWLNGDGMRSQGVISFRDDMDYSRPIGGWVNNRQRSCTTLNTVSPTGSQCRPSLESQQTDGPHMHTQPVPIPPDEDHSAPPMYTELSRPPPSIDITPPPASSR